MLAYDAGVVAGLLLSIKATYIAPGESIKIGYELDQMSE